MKKERIPDDADERLTGPEAFRWWQRRPDDDDRPADEEKDKCAKF